MSSVSVRHRYPVYLVTLLCVAMAMAQGDVLLGAGSGIQSYPRAFDPYDHMERRPVLSPQGEMRWTLSHDVAIGCVLSRTVVYGALDPDVEAAQWLTIISGGFYGEFDLSSGPGFFGAGAQVQSIVGIYHICHPQSYDNGFGVKVYGVVHQDLFSRFSAAVRTGVQRVWIQPSTWFWHEELRLDSFTIELVAYLHL